MPNSFNTPGPEVRGRVAEWRDGFFVLDKWQVTRKLTLDYGLRYELPLPFVDNDDAITAIHTGVQSVKFPQAPAGLVYPGDPGVPRGVVKTDTCGDCFDLIWSLEQHLACGRDPHPVEIRF